MNCGKHVFLASTASINGIFGHLEDQLPGEVGNGNGNGNEWKNAQGTREVIKAGNYVRPC